MIVIAVLAMTICHPGYCSPAVGGRRISKNTHPIDIPPIERVEQTYEVDHMSKERKAPVH